MDIALDHFDNISLNLHLLLMQYKAKSGGISGDKLPFPGTVQIEDIWSNCYVIMSSGL